MARRLLGADNAATVFNTQQVEEEPVTQVYTHTHTHKLMSTTHKPTYTMSPLCHSKQNRLAF